MSDERPILRATVNRKGRVVCPNCNYVFPKIPDDVALTMGLGSCPSCGKQFLIDQDCVVAFHKATSKQGSVHSKEMLRNVEDVPKIVKDFEDRITGGQ